jgi:pimeloyl-ACP methyl ester carboxylesterase
MRLQALSVIAGIFMLGSQPGFAAAPSSQPPAPRVVELKSRDGTPLKATYFSAAKPGPGVLLLHQGNRTRQSWEAVATQLAAAGINTLTIDLRLHGESGGTPFEQLSPDQRKNLSSNTKDDADAGFGYLISQPGVKKDDIGIGMAGAFGVVNGVETARRHADVTKSLVLMSGETVRDGLQYLHQAATPPGMFVVSDGDEYPPTVEAMELLYATASNPAKKFVHYSASRDAPWLWYETSFAERDKVPATGNHGTDLFQSHTDLPGMIVDWFVTTLISTPGHAPADALAAATILDELEWGGSAAAAHVTQQLLDARKRDPAAQLFPEVDVDIIGEDYGRAGDYKSAIEVFKLNLLAYPDSIDALGSLADAYAQDGQKDLARPLAQRALKLLDEGKLPVSSWSNTEQRRGEARKFTDNILKGLEPKSP